MMAGIRDLESQAGSRKVLAPEDKERWIRKLGEARAGLAPSDVEPAATYYMGFDRSTYPGDATMDTWFLYSPLFWCGFYLAPAPDHSNTGWMSKRQVLHNQGWGLAVIYVGRQPGWTGLTAANGRADAQNASTLAQQASIKLGAYLFFDVETGGTLPSNFMTYLTAWANEIYANTPYLPAFYCSHSQSASQIKSAIGTLPSKFWVWNLSCPPSPGCTFNVAPPNPTGSGYAGASVWQYAQSPKPSGTSGCTGYTGSTCTQTIQGISLTVDCDTATTSDPSNG